MLPVAQDFIGKDGQVSAYGNQLIVNAEPARSRNCGPDHQLDTAPNAC
jgi:hypothetical protein